MNERMNVNESWNLSSPTSQSLLPADREPKYELYKILIENDRPFIVSIQVFEPIFAAL